MAKTTRKKTVKKVSKKTTRRKSTVKAEAPVKSLRAQGDFLTHSELLLLQKLTSNADVYKYKMANQDQAVRNILLEQKLMEHDITQARFKQSICAAEYDSAVKKASVKVLELKEKYKIKDNFGYDPTSGKITNCK